MMISACIQQLLMGKSLSTEQARIVFGEILHEATPSQIAALLVLLRVKGETTEEICGMVQALRDAMTAVPVTYPVLDIVGTGGDSTHTINISTASSILAASCGVKVAKHGSRAVSSKSGSSNVLDALGININMNSDAVMHCLNRIGIAYCFAPIFHPSWVRVKEVRQQLGVRTVFNILGPLVNPAYAQHLLLGVYEQKLISLIATVLSHLQVTHAMVVYGCGLDELSCLGPSEVVEVMNNNCKTYRLDPKDYGFDYCELADLQGGDPQLNAAKIRAVFSGQPGPVADTIILNAGVGVYVADHVPTIHEGIELAKQRLSDGSAAKLLQNWIDYCNASEIERK